MNSDEQLHPDEREQEYEAQFFGFTVSSVIDQVYDTHSTAVDEAVLIAYRTLLKKYENDENIGKDMIRKGIEGLRDDIMKSLDKICDKLEVYLQSNILTIPKSVLLPEDTIHQDDKLHTIDESALDENIEMLKMQIRTVTKSIESGCREKAKLDPILDRCQNMRSMLQNVETSFVDVGFQQLIEDIVAMKSDATNLLEIINSLEPLETDSDSGFYDQNEIKNN